MRSGRASMPTTSWPSGPTRLTQPVLEASTNSCRRGRDRLASVGQHSGHGRPRMASLLAVDPGLRTGLALYGPDARLVWYRPKVMDTGSLSFRPRRLVVALAPDPLVEGRRCAPG